MIAFDLSLTQKVSARAYPRISKKSLRKRISPPLSVRKNTPALASWSRRSFYFHRRHFAVIFMIEVAVNASFVTAIREVDVDAQRSAKFERLPSQLL